MAKKSWHNVGTWRVQTKKLKTWKQRITKKVIKDFKVNKKDVSVLAKKTDNKYSFPQVEVYTTQYNADMVSSRD